MKEEVSFALVTDVLAETGPKQLHTKCQRTTIPRFETFFSSTHKIQAGLFFASATRQGLATTTKQPR